MDGSEQQQAYIVQSEQKFDIYVLFFQHDNMNRRFIESKLWLRGLFRWVHSDMFESLKFLSMGTQRIHWII